MDAQMLLFLAGPQLYLDLDRRRQCQGGDGWGSFGELHGWTEQAVKCIGFLLNSIGFLLNPLVSLLNPLLNPTRWLDGQKSTINNKKHNSLDLCKVVVSRWGYEHVFFCFFNFQGYIESSMIHSSWPFHHFGILEQEVLNMIMSFTLEKDWLHPREGGWSSQDLFQWLRLGWSPMCKPFRSFGRSWQADPEGD